ncbi:MAG: carboxymuconolactone decarboxylase family protein [Burkholderiaceae bacterium]
MFISSVPGSQAIWFLRPLFRLQQRKYGQELRAAAVWARVPLLYTALTLFYSALERRRSHLPPPLRALLQTYVSQLNHCAFCIDLNAANAAKRYGTLDTVQAVSGWEVSEVFDEIERVCLEYAREITLTDGQVDQLLINRLRQHFDETGVIELTALISFQNMSSKFNAALDIESMGLCQLPLKKQAP